MNTDTPRTNEALAAILERDGYLSEDNASDVLVKLCRTMERERDEARETSWFSNGIEYRKRNDYIEARNNLNPHWVVVDSQTNQKP